MRWAFVWRVAFKELLSTWRDRRTLRSTILLPLVMIPLFSVGFPLLLARAFGGQQSASQTVGVVGLAALPPELRVALTRDVRDAKGAVTTAGLKLVDVADPLAAVRAGDVDAALRLTRRGEGRFEAQVFSNASNQRVQAGAAEKVRAGLRAYNDALVARGLRGLGVDESFLRPVAVADVNTAEPRERAGGPLAFIVPYFLMQFILSGAMGPAIDSTAGEKERGTLEALLVSPVRRLEVVIGKLLATTVFAVATAFFGVIGFSLAGPLARLVAGGADTTDTFATALGGTLNAGPGDLALLLLVAISSAFLLSALVLAISVYARSFREAQTYLTPVAILLIVPLFVLQFADFIAKTPGLYALPLIGGALAILDVVKGTVQTGDALLAVASNLASTALLTLLALRSFRREDVIFRT